MSKALKNLTCGAVLAFGLGGCTGTAGVATWEYQSGAGGEVERVHEASIQADTGRGLGTEACTTTIKRQTDPLGRRSVNERADCRSNLTRQPY
jgi:hypothetical protein